MEHIEKEIPTIFAGHSSKLITDFKTYKTFIDTCIDKEIIPAHYSKVLQDLQTFLNDTSRLKDQLNRKLKVYADAAPIHDGITQVYNEIFDAMRTVINGLSTPEVLYPRGFKRVGIEHFTLKGPARYTTDNPEEVYNVIERLINNSELKLNALDEAMGPGVPNKYITNL